MPVDDQTFKDLMARFPAGVTIVTTTVDGDRHGLTVSSFASVSLDPPLVLCCIGKGTDSDAYIADAGVYAVSVLGEGQEELSNRFAGFDDIEDRFEGVAWTTAKTGSPLLEDAIAHLDCRVVRTVDAGDHTIYVGEVVSGEVLSPDAAPLVYWNRGYRSLADAGDGAGE